MTLTYGPEAELAGRKNPAIINTEDNVNTLATDALWHDEAPQHSSL